VGRNKGLTLILQKNHSCGNTARMVLQHHTLDLFFQYKKIAAIS